MAPWNRILATFLLDRITNHSSSDGIDRREISDGSGNLTVVHLGRRIIRIVLYYVIVTMLVFFGVYSLLASPLLHLFYDSAPYAGPLSIYVPGGGFSGFWFHLGFLHSMENIGHYDYYCYSSGCIATLAALMNRTINETANAGLYVQSMWQSGNVSRFELVDTFFDTLFPHDDIVMTKNFDDILPKMNILVTTQRYGYQIIQPKTRSELKDVIRKTSWVPYITGWGFLVDEDDVYYDGGFSRLLHPECAYRLDLPLIWETLIHAFSPGLNRNQLSQLWHAGNRYDYAIETQNCLNGSSFC